MSYMAYIMCAIISSGVGILASQYIIMKKINEENPIIIGEYYTNKIVEVIVVSISKDTICMKDTIDDSYYSMPRLSFLNQFELLPKTTIM